METKILEYLDQNEDRVNEWIDQINYYNKVTYWEREDTQEEDGIDLTLKTVNVLSSIFEIFKKFGGFKDEFDHSKFTLNIYGPSLIIKSIKTGVTFRLALDYKGIYLSTYLYKIKNLRHMDDQFWSQILKLPSLGEFELGEYEFYGRETVQGHQELFSNQKSNLFRIMRSYFVGSILNEGEIISPHFEMRWGYDNDLSNLILKGYETFKLLYNLNYLLWKVDDLKNKKQTKNSKTRSR